MLAPERAVEETHISVRMPNMMMPAPKAQVEVRADERAVDGLRHETFTRRGLKARTEGDSRMARMETGTDIQRIIANMNDRPSPRAPCAKKRQAVAIEIGIPASWLSRQIEGALHVDGNKDKPGGIEHPQSPRRLMVLFGEPHSGPCHRFVLRCGQTLNAAATIDSKVLRETPSRAWIDRP